jgi:predicted negative regulator of RcsB-dependent stress response
VSNEPSNNPAAFEPSAQEQALNGQFKKILLLFGVIVAGLAAYGIIQHNARTAAEAAAEAFTGAKTVDDCDLVVKKHPGTPAAANALLLKATLHWEKNEKSSSVEALKAYLAGHKDHAFYKETLLTLATRLEAMGEKSEAKGAYERVISELAGSELAQLSQLRLGDMLWADGKEEEAKKAYEEAGTKYPGVTAFEGESKTRLEWIAANLPTKEVDPPPAPKPDPKAAPASPALPNIKLNSVEGGISPTIKLGDAPAMLQPPAGVPTSPTAPAPISAPPAATPPTPKPAVPALEPAKPASATPKLEVPKSATSPAVQVPATLPAPAPAPTPAPAAPAPKP